MSEIGEFRIELVVDLAAAQGSRVGGLTAWSALLARLSERADEVAAVSNDALAEGWTLGRALASGGGLPGGVDRTAAFRMGQPALGTPAARLEALCASPVLRGLAVAQAGEAFAHAQRLVAAGHGDGGARSPAAAQQAVDAVVKGALGMWADVQSVAVGDVLMASLTDLGYQVERLDRRGRAAIYATRGPEAVALVVEGDRVISDFHGCEGGTCRLNLQDLAVELERQGLRVCDFRGSYPRHDPEDSLIVRAGAVAKATGVPMVEAMQMVRDRQAQGVGTPRPSVTEDRRIQRRRRARWALRRRRLQRGGDR